MVADAAQAAGGTMTRQFLCLGLALLTLASFDGVFDYRTLADLFVRLREPAQSRRFALPNQRSALGLPIRSLALK
jgi:hypothetical protein